MFGKTIFAWNIPDIMKGNPNDFAKLIHDAGFDGVCLKGGEGNTIFKQSLFGSFRTWGENIKIDLVQALRGYGLKVYIWSFLYGIDPVGELKIALSLCRNFRPDGYIWDAESRFDEKTKAIENAHYLAKGLRKEYPEIPQGLCWWALPKNPEKLQNEWHPVKVGKAWLETVDVLLPMIYWGGKTVFDALNYIQRSLGVWDTIGYYPMTPIGRAYTGDAGYINDLAITAFDAKVRYENLQGRNIKGISWWVLDQAYKNPDPWEALKKTPKWNNNSFETVKLSNETILARLVKEHSYLFPELGV
jgi:hypothetical protein